MAAESTLPSQPAFHHAVLRHLAKLPGGDLREKVHQAIPDLLGLTEEQRSERLPNLPHLRYRHRSGWALSMLKAARYVESPSRGVWRITDSGVELLARFPNGFDDDTGRRLIREGRKTVGEEGERPAEPTQASIQQTPQEQIEAGIREIEAAVASELLERIGSAPPEFFEYLVLELVHKLGYGGSKEDLEHAGKSGDGGIDGVISLDRLGFERVCIQAKRWQGTVGRPEIQAFFGALAGRRARKGVFITTSSFTREAREYATQVAESIVLIDGKRLTALMIESGAPKRLRARTMLR